MAGKFVYWMNVSLDLRIEHTPGESGSGDWFRIDEQLHTEFNDRARDLALMVQGRVIYETMENFWPAAAEHTTLPEYLVDYGKIWTAKPKILVSRTRTSAPYNTRILSTDAIAELAGVRATTPGRVGVGGANLATQLLNARLLDEVMLFTHPVVLGTGRPLFDGLAVGAPHPPVQLDLLEQDRFENGVTLHRYAVRDVSEGKHHG